MTEWPSSRVPLRVALAMESDPAAVAQTWRTTHGDMSDGEWALITDLVAPYWTPGGITVADRARERSGRFAKLWCDSGFKRTFIDHCRSHHVGVEVVMKRPGFSGGSVAWNHNCVIPGGWSYVRQQEAGVAPGAEALPARAAGAGDADGVGDLRDR
jgi:hypothetical protein